MQTKSRRMRANSQESKLQISAMVDVVFLLLIFFVVTIQAEDMLASLPVSKPGTLNTPPIVPAPPMLKIQVMQEGYYANNKKITIENLETSLAKIAAYAPNQDIIIICSEKALHSRLVVLLDTCKKVQLDNLHLLSQ